MALSRHRDGVALHWGADDFKDSQALERTLGRERAKDTTLDYAQAFAERRGIEVPFEVQRAAQRPVAPEPAEAPAPDGRSAKVRAEGAGAGAGAGAGDG